MYNPIFRPLNITSNLFSASMISPFFYRDKEGIFINSPYAPGPVFGLKRKSPGLNDRKEGNIE